MCLILPAFVPSPPNLHSKPRRPRRAHRFLPPQSRRIPALHLLLHMPHPRVVEFGCHLKGPKEPVAQFKILLKEEGEGEDDYYHHHASVSRHPLHPETREWIEVLVPVHLALGHAGLDHQWEGDDAGKADSAKRYEGGVEEGGTPNLSRERES